MSGFEIEELTARIKGMTLEEQRVAAQALPYEVLYEEIHRKHAVNEAKLNIVEMAVHGFSAQNKIGSATNQSYRT